MYQLRGQGFRSLIRVSLGNNQGICRSVFLREGPEESPPPYILQHVEMPTFLGSWPLPASGEGVLVTVHHYDLLLHFQGLSGLHGSVG